jgi:hypothetical protein
MKYPIPVDPSLIADWLSDGSGEDTVVESLEEVSLEEPPLEPLFPPDSEARLVTILDRLPPMEADILQLYYLKRKKQSELAQIFGVSQAAISYRIQRAIQRAAFLLELPDITEDELRVSLTEVFEDPVDIDILCGMWRTTCQSAVAIELELSQGRVRHRFFRAIEDLELAGKNSEHFEELAEMFQKITERWNILREVQLPQWTHRGVDSCS